MKMILPAAFLMLCILLGCNKAEITGIVVDGFGKPLEGATVRIAGTQFTSQTDADGTYEVGYVPGAITVSYAKPGYIPTTTTMTIATEAEYPAGAVTLYQSIPGNGIYAFSNGGYEPVTQGTLRVNTIKHPFSWNGPLVTTEYAAQGKFTRLSADDTLRFIENVSVSKTMMVVKLHSQDRIMTRVKYFTNNPKDTYTTLSFRSIPLGEGTTLIEMHKIPFGRYAFVPKGSSVGNLGHPIQDPVYLFTVLPEATCTDCEKFVGTWRSSVGRTYLAFGKTHDIYRCVGNGIEQDPALDFCHIIQNGSTYQLSCTYGKPKQGWIGDLYQMEYLAKDTIKVNGQEYTLVPPQ